jgi:hypothetical protein
MQRKSVPRSIKAADDESGTFTGLASVFDNLEAHGDSASSGTAPLPSRWASTRSCSTPTLTRLPTGWKRWPRRLHRRPSAGRGTHDPQQHQGEPAMSARDEVIARVRDALWAEFTRQAQVDTPSAPTVSRKHDYIEGEVDMDAAAEAVLRVFGDVKNEDGYTDDVDG